MRFQLNQEFLSELFELGLVIFPQLLGDSTRISSAVNNITNKDFWRCDGSKTTGLRKSPTLLTSSALVAGSNELTYKILYEEPLFCELVADIQDMFGSGIIQVAHATYYLPQPNTKHGGHFSFYHDSFVPDYRTLVTIGTSEKGMTFIDKYNIKQQVSLHVPHGTVIGLPQERVAAVNNMSYRHRVEGTWNTCTLVLELDFVGGMNLMKAMQNWRAEKFSIPGHKYEIPVLDASVVAMDEVHHGNDLQVCVEKALVAMGKSPLYRFMIQRI